MILLFFCLQLYYITTFSEYHTPISCQRNLKLIGTCMIPFQVYKLSIGVSCGLSWPSNRFIVQVLDDSTNETLKVIHHLQCLTFSVSTFFLLIVNIFPKNWLAS